VRSLPNHVPVAAVKNYGKVLEERGSDLPQNAEPFAMPDDTTKTFDAVWAEFDLDGFLIKGSANIPLAKTTFRAGFVSRTELSMKVRVCLL
jgi:hypothetical protein